MLLPNKSKGLPLVHAHLCVLLLLCSWSSLAYATDFQAKVIHISDGDTITVLNNAKEEIKIRVNGIDCPETGQAFGQKAKAFTKDGSIPENGQNDPFPVGNCFS